ncbi:Pol polyprotein [Plakobranchus ocellatus]|uniref:Pol polyprotein n=1 Tax=Plakobranchus ocellatus TaxID=259542 RepID=A0AAV3ZUV6_9GAST|nr:Pol polyprotein [Plakobranchus ocellatus]
MSFHKADFDPGDFTAVYHSIDRGQMSPIRQRMRSTPIHFKDEEDAHLDKMLETGVMQPSTAGWASLPVLVRKRDGSVRWCVDYRALNNITRKDVFPLPRIEECVDALDGNLWFPKLDANSAYWQVRLDDASRPKTSFCTRRDPFILDTDASDFAIGAELLQIQGGVERAISYGNYTLSKEQRYYCTTRKELLAVVRFTRQFRPYLLGRHFYVRTDHNSLRWLMDFREAQGQLAW